MRRAAFVMIVAALVAGGAWAHAQQAPYQMLPPTPPNIRTGADIGFRVDSTKNGKAIGRLVVRLKSGDWVDVEFSTGPNLIPVQ